MLNTNSILNQCNDFGQRPNVVGQSGFHCRGDAQGLVNAAEVVIHEVYRSGMFVILQLLAKRIGEAGKTAVAHAEREVLAFDMAGGDKGFIRAAADALLAGTGADGWRVADFADGVLIPIDFHQLGVINLRTERAFNGFNIGFVAVAGELDAPGEAFGQIVDELIGVGRTPLADVPAGNQLGFSINGNPRPCVADFVAAFEIGGNILLLGVGEAPDFVHLEQLAVQTAHGLVHVGGTGRARTHQHAFHGFLGCARQTAGATHRAAFNQAVEDLGAFVSGKDVHNRYSLTLCLTQSKLASTYSFNKNETKEIRPSEARQGRGQGRVDRREVFTGRGENRSRCGQAFWASEVRLDSEHLAWRGQVVEISGSTLELEGIGPSTGRFTVRRRHQTSPFACCLCLAGGAVLSSTIHRTIRFLFWATRSGVTCPRVISSWDKKDRQSSRKAFREKARFSAQNCDGQNGASRCQAFLPAMRAKHQTKKNWKRLDCIGGQKRPKETNLTAVSSLSLGFAGSFAGSFNRLVGDRNHIAQDGVHPGVGVGRAFLGRLLHADNSTEDLAYA